jgi:hypothetical protein
MYELKIEPIIETVGYTYAKSINNLNIIHARLGHIGSERILKTLNCSVGLNSELKNEDLQCETCLLTKSKYKTHKLPPERRSHKILDVVAIDYKGPLNIPCNYGYTGYLVFVDISPSFGMVFGIKKKHEITEKFKIYRAFMERQTGRKIKCIRSDQAKEYTEGQFIDLLRNLGIRQEQSSADSQASNGVAESRIRILTTMARSMMTYAQVKQSFWYDAIKCSNYIYNRVVNTKNFIQTPYELIFSNKPRLDYLRIFGCKAYYYVMKKYRKTFDNTSGIGRFMGYDDNSNTYIIWTGRKYLRTRHVEFHEESFDIKFRNPH